MPITGYNRLANDTGRHSWGRKQLLLIVQKRQLCGLQLLARDASARVRLVARSNVTQIRPV